MTNKTLLEVPAGMRKVYQRFERWRRSHRGRLPIPAALWGAATDLAREHGVFRTAKALHLDHSKLKGMVKSTKPAVRRAAVAPAGFLELVAPPATRLRCSRLLTKLLTKMIQTTLSEFLDAFF